MSFRRLHKLLPLSDFLYRQGQFIFFGRVTTRTPLGCIGDFWARFDVVDGKISTARPSPLTTAVRFTDPVMSWRITMSPTSMTGSTLKPSGNPDGLRPWTDPHYPQGVLGQTSFRIDSTTIKHDEFPRQFLRDRCSHAHSRVMRKHDWAEFSSHPFCNQPAIGGPIYWIRTSPTAPGYRRG